MSYIRVNLDLTPAQLALLTEAAQQGAEGAASAPARRLWQKVSEECAAAQHELAKDMAEREARREMRKPCGTCGRPVLWGRFRPHAHTCPKHGSSCDFDFPCHRCRREARKAEA